MGPIQLSVRLGIAVGVGLLIMVGVAMFTDLVGSFLASMGIGPASSPTASIAVGTAAGVYSFAVVIRGGLS